MVADLTGEDERAFRHRAGLSACSSSPSRSWHWTQGNPYLDGGDGRRGHRHHAPLWLMGFIADHCPVHRTLHGEVQVHTRLRGEDA
ncbi:MAG TPA: hypothetical protein DIC52_05460 [Candidatus Latescibacteria bacterium]|nr:hypothetical protein [Candidatus Latescibacterota bacterium]